jgi:hypothetical protein
VHTVKSCQIYSKNVTTSDLVVTGPLSAPRLDMMEWTAQRQRQHRAMSNEIEALQKRVDELVDRLQFQNISDGEVVITGAPLVIRPPV